MPSQRCGWCDLDMPTDKKECPVCKRETMEMKYWPHDPQWAIKAARLKKRPAPGQPIPNISVALITKDNQVFIAEELLIDNGYADPETGMIVKINSRFYELGGAIYRHSDFPGWWLLEVPTEGVVEDAFPEAWATAATG